MGRSAQPRFNRTDLVRGAVGFVVSVLGLVVAGWILPGIGFDGLLPVVLVALVMAVAGLVVRPVMVAIATPLGWLGVGSMGWPAPGCGVHRRASRIRRDNRRDRRPPCR